MIGFVIWSLLGVFIIGLGIKDMFSKNPVGFWANTETIKVKDVKGYNRASGLLFIIYGIIFVILGIPLLDGQNTPYVLLSVIGVMVETIVIMAAYSLVIVKKYEEKKITLKLQGGNYEIYANREKTAIDLCDYSIRNHICNGTSDVVWLWKRS